MNVDAWKIEIVWLELAVNGVVVAQDPSKGWLLPASVGNNDRVRSAKAACRKIE